MAALQAGTFLFIHIPEKYPARGIPFLSRVLYRKPAARGSVLHALVAGPRHDDMESFLHDSIRFSLEPGEDLIWSGRPDPWRLAKARFPVALSGITLLVLLPFAPVHVAVAAFVPFPVSFTSVWPFSAALLFIALHLVLSPLRGYRAAQRTAYVVTDRRLCTVRRTATGNMSWSKSFHAIEDAVLRLRPDGTGDIIVRPKVFADWTDEHASGFDRIRGVVEARKIHGLILKALAASRAGSAAEPIRDYLDLLIQGKRTLNGHRQL